MNFLSYKHQPSERMKYNTYYLIIALIISLISGCSSHVDADKMAKILSKKPDVSLLKSGTILYRGYITFDGYESLVNSFNEAKAKGLTPELRIKSRGGYSMAGIMLGRFIKEHDIPLIIDTYCLSACAHYIFPAGSKKTFRKNAIAGFHAARVRSLTGEYFLTKEEYLKEFDEMINDPTIDSITQRVNKGDADAEFLKANKEIIKYFPEYQTHCQSDPSIFDGDKTKEQILRSMKNTQIDCFAYKDKLNNQFYNDINVDPRLPEIGLAKLTQAQASDNNIKFFYYDLPSLQALGITNIIISNPWNPTANVKSKQLIEVSLADWQHTPSL